MTNPNQTTLKHEITFSGVGIHTGIQCTVKIVPSPVNSGRVFITPKGSTIPARVDYALKCDRSTVLGKNGETVRTPEHLLSAMAALGVDNAQIEMTGPEIPILDGSALEFFTGLKETGLDFQDEPARVISINKPYSVHGKQGQLVLALPSAQSTYKYSLYYEHPMLGYQSVSFEPSTQNYEKLIAPARTFALWEEVKPLIERGMAQGGNFDNALVVYQDKFSSELSVKDEPVCHKCLDLIGDFALLDARVVADIVAVKAGHQLHVDCAKLIWQER